MIYIIQRVTDGKFRMTNQYCSDVFTSNIESAQFFTTLKGALTAERKLRSHEIGYRESIISDKPTFIWLTKKWYDAPKKYKILEVKIIIDNEIEIPIKKNEIEWNYINSNNKYIDPEDQQKGKIFYEEKK